MIATKPPVETFQTPFELDQLVSVVESLNPSTVLEVGAWQGGTLWHWLRTADAVAVVDDRMQLRDEWNRWADEALTFLVLIEGRSDDAAVVERVRRGAPYDFVFIDADHSYEAAWADWHNYGPLVSDGGVVAFHDIIERPGYGVSRLWAEIKAAPGARWMEINETVEPGDETKHGVGLVWL